MLENPNPRKTKFVRTLAIIPARGGSKGLPGKNIRPLAGLPLIAHAIRAARDADELDACIVSTDSEKIARIAKKYGGDVPFLRPARIAKDTSRDIEYIAHALFELKKLRGWEPEIIVMLQPTTPGRTGHDIDHAIRLLRKTKADSVRTMIDPGHFNPFKMWIRRSHGVKPLLSITSYKKLGYDVPRQQLPEYLLPFGLVYAFRARNIGRGSVWGGKMVPLVVSADRHIDIDTLADFRNAESKIKKI